MNRKCDRKVWWTLLTVTVAVFVAGGERAAAQNAPTFDVVEVAPFPDFYPGDLNSRGEVVGGKFVEFPNEVYRRRAVRWADGVMTFLDVDPTRSSFADSINDSGQIFGTVYGSTDEFDRLFLMNSEDDVIDPYLGDLFDGPVQSNEINNAGQITLRYKPSGETEYRPYFFDGETMHPLIPESATYGEVFGLNNLGQAVGRYDDPYRYGFFWDDGLFVTIGETGESVAVVDINDAGQAVGSGRLLNTGEFLPFLYEGGELQILGTLGGSRSDAVSINARGWIVGVSSRAEPDSLSHAFLVIGAIMYDLNELVSNDLPWELVAVTAINDRGQILALGYPKGSVRYAFLLLTPSIVDTVEELIELIEGYGLPNGIENSFLVKLEHALEAIEAGNLELACQQLNAFVSQVNAQTGKALTEDQAAELLEGVDLVRADLGCQ